MRSLKLVNSSPFKHGAELDFSLETLKEDDLPWVLKCRNDSKIREISTSHKIITDSEHRDWWLDDKNEIRFVFRMDRKPLGLMRYTRHPPNGQGTKLYWSFWIDPYYMGNRMGYGRALASLSMLQLKLHNFYGFKELYAEVLFPVNTNSITIHESLGFKLNDLSTFQSMLALEQVATYVYQNPLFSRGDLRQSRGLKVSSEASDHSMR